MNDDGHRPSLLIASLKTKDLVADLLPPGGALSPDIKPPGFTPLLTTSLDSAAASLKCIGQYLLVEKLSSTSTLETFKAVHISSQEEFICKVYPLNKYRDLLAPYWQSGSHPHIADIIQIILGETQAYVLFARSYEDLHSYIRKKRRLRESEAADLFGQIVLTIKHCHKRGIVLRDLKLRKFVFADQQRSHLVLDGLEDAFLLEDADDDHLTDKHGCPAYVSPEILSSHGYSGKSADMWSLGVILYTMLFGQYPFHDTVASQLFGKIRRGYYTVPDSVSAPARCLVRSLLRTEPAERLTITEACNHPWFVHARCRSVSCAGVLAGGAPGVKPAPKEVEQKVPEIVVRPMQDELLST